jgi:ElaB/YqjD/DUF883 family membrane-anchored ribosome-binding protein
MTILLLESQATGGIMNTETYEDCGIPGIKKEELVADIEGIVADADDLLKDVTNATEEELAAARSRLRARLSEAMSKLAAVKETVGKKACCVAKNSCDYARDNPWKIAGAAIAGIVTAIVLIRCSCGCRGKCSYKPD